ncbi:MAG: MFS transporter, partial [Planctomycetota bacterium]
MSAARDGMKLSFLEKFGYGLGDTASNFVWALMMNFIMYFYTDIFGITAAAAGTMLLFARSTDGFFYFFVGAVADRTQTRWGRFRPWLVRLCVPLGIVFVLCFTTPDLSAGRKLAWAWVTYNLLMLTYSAINIPYG